MAKERKSNIELLRIVAMLLIISFHYCFHSNYVVDSLNFNAVIVKSFYFFGELGVDLFILITGYFCSKSEFSVKKLIKLILEVNFYYLFCVLLTFCFDFGFKVKVDTFKDCFLLFFNVITNKYWFITMYIIAYTLSPYINIIINNISKENYKKLIITLLVIWCIIPTIFGIFYNSTESLLYYNRLIWFMVMYLIGGYIRKYQIKFFEKKKNTYILAIGSFLFMILSIFVFYRYRYFLANLGNTEIAYFWPPNTLPMVLLSISVFEIFLNLKIKNNKLINVVASTTLGIYMVHDGLFYKFIWDKVLKSTDHLYSRYSICYILISTALIFVFGAIIELIRQFIEKHTVTKFLNSKYFDKICNISKKVYKKFVSFI